MNDSESINNSPYVTRITRSNHAHLFLSNYWGKVIQVCVLKFYSKKVSNFLAVCEVVFGANESEKSSREESQLVFIMLVTF